MMKQCIQSGYRWSICVSINNEEEFLDEMSKNWDHCQSFLDICRVKVRGLSVFYYQATLATWFYGLDLVSFENKGYTGRCLEIA